MTLGLRARVSWAFAAYSAVVAFAAMGVTHVVIHVIEDRIIDRHLAVETERVRGQLEAGEAPAPSDRTYRAYVGAASLPDPLASVALLPDGRHELEEDAGEAQERFVSVAPLTGRSERLYLVYEAPEEPFGLWIEVAVGALALGLFAAGTGLGVLTARRIVRPVSELAAAVSRPATTDLADELSRRTFDPELQIVVDRLVTGLRARDAFMAREERFTRYASHELRTPVTVIQGAAEVLRAAPEATSPRIAAPLERIERASAELYAVLESFLWLARDREAADRPAAIAVVPVVDRVVERLATLVGPQVEVHVERRGDARAHAPAGVVEVVVGNLVSNALRATERGSVTITIDGEALTVADTGPGMTPDAPREPGHGIGLTLVRSICARFGWVFELESAPGAGVRATVRFASEPDGAYYTR